jgi:hypothetical protein
MLPPQISNKQKAERYVVPPSDSLAEWVYVSVLARANHRMKPVSELYRAVFAQRAGF